MFFFFFFLIIYWVSILRLFEYFDRYLVDKEFKIIIDGRGINIINYVEVIDFSSSRVVIRYDKGTLLIIGSDLVVSKMLEEELLITGVVKSIEYN